MDPTLIDRARTASSRFDHRARKPVVVEFAGSPKAGKTSTIAQIAAFLKRCGFRVEVVIERASVCPIRDKKHANFNIWTVCTTLAQLLEKTQDPPRTDDPQVLILDRGLFDSLCWLRMMERLSRLRKQDRKQIEAFLMIEDWRKRITGVILMSASSADAMERERGYLPVPGAAGSIMNNDVLDQIRNTFDDVANHLGKMFRIVKVDTSSRKLKNNPEGTCELIADKILNLIEQQLNEDILYVSRATIESCFSGKPSLVGSDSRRVLDLFRSDGQFRTREEVESESTLVQALPVVVVRNKSGDVLRLRRRERTKDNPLHEELVLWAGGHVRSEDASNGDPIMLAALRELHEELRLDVEQDALQLLGAIHVTSEQHISKHVAIVFEWRAATDDVAVNLCSAEFFERRGTSLSGKFETIESLVSDVESKKMSEVWSVAIIRDLLPEAARRVEENLF